MAVEEYYKHYEDQELFFDRSLLTTYCLSLHTKPFVILSGISGTGKTKIAQFFSVPARLGLPQPPPAVAPAAGAPAAAGGDWAPMTITDGLINGDGRTNLKFEDLPLLLTKDEIKAIQPEIDRLKAAGKADNIGEPIDFTIKTATGEILRAQAYLQRAQNPLLRIRFTSKRGDKPAWDSRPYLKVHYKVGDVLKLKRIGDKQLEVVSVNDQAAIGSKEQRAQEDAAAVSNTCFISVRSDWTDSTSLFGYYNLIDQRFYLTPLLSFILKAREYPQLPFFLILDEMNLARVEHYFSDFLSALESRSLHGADVKQEPIHLHSGSGWVETNDAYFDLVGSTLELPTNLYVTGTVNIDESTYMFSPKVLDRANVIELNEVDINGYGGDAMAPKNARYVLKTFPDLASFTLPTRSDFKNLDASVKEVLIGIHSILSAHHLQFGYRVINEISKYVANAVAHCEAGPHLLNDAIDCQIIQKILPKLNGPQSKLDLPIRELLTFLTTGKVGPAMDVDAVNKLEPITTSYPQSVAKLKRMSLALSINGFANFIE